MICNNMRRYTETQIHNQNTEFEISHEMINEVQQTIGFNEVGIIFLYLAHYIHHSGTSKLSGGNCWCNMIKYKGLSLRIITSDRAEADTNKLSYLPHDDDWMLINARQWRPSAEPACGGDKGCTNTDSLRTEECQIYEDKNKSNGKIEDRHCSTKLSPPQYRPGSNIQTETRDR